MLENLWPYLDADPGYSRDKLMTRPVEAAQVDGKLYQLPINFGITTAVGLGRIVGDYTTWTLADVKNALSKLPKARWYSTSITPSRRCSCIASP